MMSMPRVLVIDDSHSTCFLISTTLRRVGYEVEVALTGQEGLAKLATFRPHCLILDVLLPDSNGYALCRLLRQNPRTQHLPLILMSAKNASLDINYGLRQGANRYLPKPFTAETLLQNVWEVLPGPVRSWTHPAIPALQPEQASPLLLKLIPRRTLRPHAMQTSNPLASAPLIKDQRARLLFSKIDGKHSVARLAALTGLEMDEVTKALRVLLNEQNVLLYNEAGLCVNTKL